MGLLRGLPKGIFRGEERYVAQVDMCHFGLVGSGNPNPSNFRATHMAAATLRPTLTPLVADLNGYCTSNAPPWFTWCSIQVVRPQGTDTMGLHSHLRDGAPMALIVCVGSFTGGEFWVEGGGLLNPSMREKKRHTRVCKGRAVEGWASTATPQAPVLFNTRALHASYGYSNQMGYQTSDFRLLWTITPNPPPPTPFLTPPPTPTPFLTPPPPPCQTSPPPVSPPISDLSHCHHTLEV